MGTMATVAADRTKSENAALEQTDARRVRFDVDEYGRMADAGIFHEDSRVELIDGEILEMSPIGSRHVGIVARLTGLLTRRLGARIVLLVQSPVRLSESSEPQPDLALAKPRPDTYTKSLPGPKDLSLLIEVMDSSADFDRGVKLGLYARAKIAEVWLVDLNDETVASHHGPRNGLYSEVHTFTRGESLAPQAFPKVKFRVDAILS